MPSEILKLTTEIVVAHSSVTELTPDQLVDEIKAVYNVLASLEGGATLEEPAGLVKKSSVPRFEPTHCFPEPLPYGAGFRS